MRNGVERTWKQGCVLAVVLAVALPAAGMTIGFDDLGDATAVTTQYAGLTFGDATAVTAGLSLNELEFPPRSGSNVVFDDGGPLTISFATPVRSVFGYFTHATSLTLSFVPFDVAEVLGPVTSAFAANLALSGDAGAVPNELLGTTSLGGISAVTISGDPAGASFTLDDLAYEPLRSGSVPEPTTLLLVAAGVVGLGRRRALGAG